jgi:hypothetical protein
MFQSTNTQIQARMQDELAKLKALIAFGDERRLAMRWIDAHSQVNEIWFNRSGSDYGCSEFIAQSIDEISRVERAGLVTRYQAECAFGALVAMYRSSNYLQHCRKFGMR